MEKVVGEITESPEALESHCETLRMSLSGQRKRVQLETAEAQFGTIYSRMEIARKIGQTLPFRLFKTRRAEFCDITIYRGHLPDKVLLRLEAAIKSRLFESFSVGEPTYSTAKGLDPWLIGWVSWTQGVCLAVWK